MSTLFIADIHLCIQKPEITAGFLYFLRNHATTIQALYILGDLFEAWIGDDDYNSLHHDIAMALRALSKRGIPCYFIHGNRDFLLGHHYAKACGMILLPTQQVIQVVGVKIVILHGDVLCTNDSKYQYFRRFMHQRWLQLLFLTLPLQIRRYLADKIRTHSLYINAKKGSDIMDIDPYTVMKIFSYTDATVMIHGHTHRSAIHLLPGKRWRIVLGAWQQRQGSVIEITNKGITLHKFPFKG